MNAETQSVKIALLIMVHGSPKPEANAPMFAVVDSLRRRDTYQVVEVGFMECNEPSIPESIDNCIAQGAVVVIAVPYFLHVGTHVAEDLPTLLEEAQVRHPEVKFRMGRYLGKSPEVTELLSLRARTALQDHRMLAS